jgi:hypothetical protein
MALSLKLSRLGINSTGEEMYIQDVTGDYSAENTGGWGVPNALRSEKALLIQGIQRTSTTDDTATFVEYDPETVSTFVLDTTVDGYYDIILVAVDKVTPTVEGTYGWTSSGGLVQFSGGVLVSKVPEDLYKDILFLDAVSFKTVLLARSSILRNRKLLELVQAMKAGNNDRGHSREIVDLSKNFDYIRTLLESARLFWCSDLYTEAQIIVESLNELSANG